MLRGQGSAFQFSWQLYNQDKTEKEKQSPFSITWRGVSWQRFHTTRSWHRLTSTHALAGAGITSPLYLCKGPAVTQGWVFQDENVWVPREWLNEHNSFLFQHSSGEVILGQCFTRHQAQLREISHSWKKWAHDTSCAVWATAAGDRC